MCKIKNKLISGQIKFNTNLEHTVQNRTLETILYKKKYIQVYTIPQPSIPHGVTMCADQRGTDTTLHNASKWLNKHPFMKIAEDGYTSGLHQKHDLNWRKVSILLEN